VKRLEARIRQLEEKNEQLKLDSEYLADELDHIQFIVDHQPLFRKGEVVRGRYRILELVPLRQVQPVKVHQDIAVNGLVGTGIAALADFFLGTRLEKVVWHYTKKHAWLAGSMKKTFWKYVVYDEVLHLKDTKLENELTFYLKEGSLREI
jgi:hypothetical protein